MNIQNRHTLVYDYTMGIGVTPTLLSYIDAFHRIGYFVHLQHPVHGNQWIYTEFDTFTQDITQVYPRPNEPGYYGLVHNVHVCHNGRVGHHHIGNLLLTSRDYVPENGLPLQQGTYGAMQMSLPSVSDSNILWTYNNILSPVADIGIGPAPLGFPDWTFHANSNEYSIKGMRIYTVSVSFDTMSIPMKGFVDGDSPVWDAASKMWTSKQIPYDVSAPHNEPNFIIAITGQSNSQGFNAFYDPTQIEDQPDSRIMGFNPETNMWEEADMRTESIGSFWHRQQNSQSLAFHFAKRLIEVSDGKIRPGIINMGIGGQPIARWAMYEPEHPSYGVNQLRANGQQGDIFLVHKHRIETALSKIHKKSVDVICWHQGEADTDATYEYYRESMYRVIDQYRHLDACNERTPFVVGETAGHRFGDNMWWVKQNVVLKGIEGDGDPFTRCVHSRDLRTNGPQDSIHFSAEGQRHMGSLYFRTYREML
jgi:hypothetical protein